MPDWRYAIEGRLAGLRLPPSREAEIVDELSQHLDDRYAELTSQDLTEADARRAALAELDAADLIAELTGIEATRIEPLPLGGGLTDGAVSSAWHDLRLGGRMLLKDAAASLMIVLTLGLAIAANTIVFGFTDLLLLRPLPIGNAGRMIAIFGVDRRQSSDRLGVSIPDYLELKSHMTTVDDVLAMRTTQVSLAGTGDPTVVSAAYATANLFHLWDVSPALGRLMRAPDDEPASSRVAVSRTISGAAISHPTRRWSADRSR